MSTGGAGVSCCLAGQDLSVFHYLHVPWTQTEGSSPFRHSGDCANLGGISLVGNQDRTVTLRRCALRPWESSWKSACRTAIYALCSPLSRAAFGWVRFPASAAGQGAHQFAIGCGRLLNGLVFAMAEDSSGASVHSSPGDQHQSCDPAAPMVPSRSMVWRMVCRIIGSKPCFRQAGNLWIGTDNGLCRWRPGTRAVCSTLVRDKSIPWWRAPLGSYW